MALNTCDLWSNGIKIASLFYKRITKNYTAAGSLAPTLLPDPRLRWAWVTLVYSAHLPIYTFALFIFGLSPLPIAKSWLRANTQATTSDFPIYILIPLKVSFKNCWRRHYLWFGSPQSKILATSMPLVVHTLLQLVIFMTKQKSLRNFFEWIIIYH